ncbi:kelch-like protein [Cystobacter fuscus]|uniref:Kelch repeat-containing protein n=1 Tax=Cystobacter fuscus TaxID=43 RepID=UPI002B31FD86|nr:kelch-like protein [Cystobacter fuscus]
MKRAFIPWMLALTVALLAGCSVSSSETSSARFAVSVPQALSSEIARVSVTSSASDIPSVTVELAPTRGIWGGTLGNIPAGAHRSFQARAFDASGLLLFQGAASGITLAENQTTLVVITLQEVNPPPAFDNEAPLIDFLEASAISVPVGGSLSLVASAHDPNPGDTLSYDWTATSGSFSSPSNSSTSWTAPASTGIETLTLTVTDSRGLSARVVLAIQVSLNGGTGEAQLSIAFNSSPRVASLTASPTRLPVGQTTSVSVSASDPDGDILSYAWSASCAGSWSNASSSSARFTPSLLPAGACNNCRLTVSVSDGHGGLNTGTVALCISNTLPSHQFPPDILRTYRSSDSATPGQVLTYEVVASDPQGSDLSFYWEASTGVLDPPSRDASRSRVTWTAPSCVSDSTPPSITVNVVNDFSRVATRSFAVTGLPICPPPVGSWARTGSMVQPRRAHRATVLSDGKVLVSGGVLEEYEVDAYSYKTAEVYDPATGTWRLTGSMADERAYHTLTPLPDGKVLVVGGTGLDAVEGTVGGVETAEVYDPATGVWSPTGSMADERTHHTATPLPDGKVLVVGGGNRPTAELYDPATGTWSATGSMASPRYDHTATLLPDGKVLVAGGWSGTSFLATAEVYDPATGTWSATGSMASSREGHTATRLSDGKVLVVGGRNLPTAELYDPATGTWSTTGSMAEAHFTHTATLLPDGRVLVVGGFGGIEASQVTAEVYDPATGTWRLAAPMLIARQKLAAVLLPNGKVLIAGGHIVDGDIQLASAELFTP